MASWRGSIADCWMSASASDLWDELYFHPYAATVAFWLCLERNIPVNILIFGIDLGKTVCTLPGQVCVWLRPQSFLSGLDLGRVRDIGDGILAVISCMMLFAAFATRVNIVHND